MKLGSSVRKYLDEVVSWDIVAGQYNEAYDHARSAKRTGKKVEFPSEF